MFKKGYVNGLGSRFSFCLIFIAIFKVLLEAAQKNTEKTCSYKKLDSHEDAWALEVKQSSGILRMYGIFYLFLCELPPELM